MKSSSTARADLRSRRRGFTLFEVLVTVGLVAIVMGLAALVLLSSADSATRSRLRAEQETELLRVASMLRHQMMAIAAPLSTQTSVVSEAGQVPRSDTLDIITAGLVYSRGVGRAEWHMIRDAGEEPYLAYREEPYLGGADPKKNPWIPFSRLVSGIEFRFWSSPSWVPGWHQSVVPERMRAIVYYDGGEGEESFVVEAAPGVAQVVETSSSGGSGNPSSSSPGTAASPSPGATSGGATSGGTTSGAPPGTGTTSGGTLPGQSTSGSSGSGTVPGMGTSSGGGTL